MAKFRKKSEIIEAITFQEMVSHGVKAGGNIVNGMPWSFEYKGHNITHENNQRYLIPTPECIHNMTPCDMLVTSINGEIYTCKQDIFNKTYELVTEDGLATQQMKLNHSM